MVPDEHSKFWYLSRINLFKELPMQTLKEISETSRMRDYEKDNYISTPHDDDGERIYFLKKGEVEVYEAAEDGKRITIDVLEPGDIFGYINIPEKSQQQSRRFIKATAPATICIMPRRDFLELLGQKPELALRLIKMLSERLVSAEERLRGAALSDVETRVLAELERLAERYGSPNGDKRKLGRKFTHEEFAHFVGTARETITRALSALAKKRKITIDKDGNIILR